MTFQFKQVSKRKQILMTRNINDKYQMKILFS